MRIVLHQYAKGGHCAFETTNDGSEIVRVLDGRRQPGKRICAYVEIACDDDSRGLDRLKKAIEWITEEVERRQDNPVPV